MYRVYFLLFFVSNNFWATGQNYVELSNKILQLYNEGKYAEAIPIAINAKEAAKKEFGNSSGDYAMSLNNLTYLYQKMGNFTEAIPVYKEASFIWKKLLGEEDSTYLTILNNLANLYIYTGNFISAEPLYKQVLNIRKKVFGVEHPDYATSLNNLAFLYFKMGNYTSAEPLYKQALNINKLALGEGHYDYAINLNNIGLLYVFMGNFTAAEPLYKQASAIMNKSLGEEHPDYATNLTNLADLYQKMGNYTDAEPIYKQVLTIRKKVLGEVHPDYATSLNNLAVMYVFMEDYAAAESLYKQALTNTKKVLGEEHPDYATSLNNLAGLYMSMGNYSAAEPLFKEAKDIYKKKLGEEHPDYTRSLHNLAGLYETMGNYDAEANLLISGTTLMLNHIEKNFSTLSEAEKLIWWENKNGYFQLAPSLLLTNSNTSINFLLQTCSQQLQLKGYVLNNEAKVLMEARKKGSPQLKQLLTLWITNKAVLAKQYSLPIAKRITQLDSLEKETNEQEKQINKQSAIFRANKVNQQIGFHEVQKNLKQDEAAVEFIRFEYYHKHWTDSILYAAFIILPKATIPHFLTLCEEKQLAGLLESKSMSSEQFVKQLYRGATITNKLKTDGKKGESLYNLVWKPLLPFLKGIKKVSIAPAGLLNRVAFNALPVDSGHYLIDIYQIRQYNSIRQIAEQRIPLSSSHVPVDVVLFGGIDFNVADSITVSNNEPVTYSLPYNVKRSIRGSIWNSLPGTLLEVNEISQLFKTNKINTRVITGAFATEESFKQLSGQSPAILHLATHGFSLADVEKKRKNNLTNNENQFTIADNPLLRSGIIMSGANRVWGGDEPFTGKDDGIVTAYEISNLDLNNTGLVVLSACETALGDIKGTEGVFGLQRAFKLAGVQNMLLSLWQIPDKETAELMNQLYSNKLKGMNNYVAFNKAQNTLRKKYPPYYWAAFVLIE